MGAIMAGSQCRYRSGPVAPDRYANALRQVRADAGWNPADIQRRDNARRGDTEHHDYGTHEDGVLRRAATSRHRPGR